MTDLVPCEACRLTGQADQVNRGFFAPGTCQPCRGKGWVRPERNVGMSVKDKPEWDRVSVNAGPYFQPRAVAAKLDVFFNGVRQANVVEYCISEGWIQRYARDWRGKPVMNGEDFVLGPKLKGTVDVRWKIVEKPNY